MTSLVRTDVEWDPEAKTAFLADINLETDRLAELVETLLAASDPHGSKRPGFKLELTRPADVVQSALQRTRCFLLDRSVQLDLPLGLPRIWVDGPQMERALANLLQNAVKYSPPDTPIAVSARIAEEGELEIAVEDEGTGIPLEDQQHIFEPFFRTHEAKQSHIAGHGLGLAISSCIVRRHGGRMFVNNRRGGGARFHLVLPIPWEHY